MINNCQHRIKSIVDVLTVYKSSKGDANDAIGENGVGVKQGCATLSNLSFVLSRNNYTFSIGVVAFALQKHSGIYLPSFEFTWTPDIINTLQSSQSQSQGQSQLNSSLQNFLSGQLYTICNKDKAVGQVIKTFGGGKVASGVRRLMLHFYRMTRDLWSFENNPHVFSLVIHNLKHGQVLDQHQHDEFSSRETRQNNHVVKGFLSQIHEKLPKHYLHVAHSFDFQVGGKRVHFAYWQRRLCEMAKFTVVIDKKDPLDAELLQLYARDKVPDHDYHTLNVYLGFDAMRCGDKNIKGNKCATIYYHSRRAGRLIKHHRDARGELCLSSGGTMYCQGLTIIVDDSAGALPLNPTKQDFAFGEKTHGETWLWNMKLWIAGITKVYYNHHLDNYDGLKKTLTAHVEALANKAQVLIDDDEQDFNSIEECGFSYFKGMNWKYNPTNVSLQLNNRKDCKIHLGEDVLMRLPPKSAITKIQGKSSPRNAIKSKSKSKSTSKSLSAIASASASAPKRAPSTSAKRRMGSPKPSSSSRSDSSISIPRAEQSTKRRRLADGVSVVVGNDVLLLNDVVILEYKESLAKSNEALAKSNRARGDLELDRDQKDEKIEDLIEALNDAKNARDGLLHDLESKDEQIDELEMALQEVKDKEDNSAANADLQNENDQLKKRLGEVLVQLEIAKM